MARDVIPYHRNRLNADTIRDTMLYKVWYARKTRSGSIQGEDGEEQDTLDKAIASFDAKDKWIANSAYISDDEDMDHNLNSDDNYNSADEYNARGIGLNREDNHGKYVHVGRKRRAQTPPSPCQRQGLTHTYSQASKRSRFLNN